MYLSVVSRDAAQKVLVALLVQLLLPRLNAKARAVHPLGDALVAPDVGLGAEIRTYPEEGLGFLLSALADGLEQRDEWRELPLPPGVLRKVALRLPALGVGRLQDAAPILEPRVERLVQRGESELPQEPKLPVLGQLALRRGHYWEPHASALRRALVQRASQS